MKKSNLGIQALASVMAASSMMSGRNIIDIEPAPIKRKPIKTFNKSKEQQRRLKRMDKREGS